IPNRSVNGWKSRSQCRRSNARAACAPWYAACPRTTSAGGRAPSSISWSAPAPISTAPPSRSESPVPAAVPSPFHFWTRLTLTKLTGRGARDLAELVEILRQVPPSVVFHHTHHFLVQHQHLSPEPPNDFAFWVKNVLQEDELGEQLAAIDTIQFPSLKELRTRICGVIDQYLEQRRALRTAPAGEEFYFQDAISFVLPTRHQATTLAEFARAIETVGDGTIAYHLFEARLRVGSDDNDFSRW